jgi:hypothetical protein
MEFMELLQINWALLISIVGLCEYLKSFDKKKKLSKFYPLLPLLVSGIACYFMNIQTPIKTFSDWIIYMGMSIVAYEMILKLVKGFFEKAMSINNKEIAENNKRN